MLVKHRTSFPERSLLSSLREICHPTIVFRPQYFHDEALDLRNFNGHTGPEYLGPYRETAPIVARLESYGTQSVGAFRFNCTRQPREGGYRYGMRPSANGGVCILPPEVSLEELRDGKVSASDAKVSRSWFVVPRFTRLGFGLPSTDFGSIQNKGIAFLYGDSLDRVQVAAMDATGALNSIGDIDKDGWGFGTPYNRGNGTGVIGLADASIPPSANPTSGIVLYSLAADHFLRYRMPDGTTILLDDRVDVRKNSAGSVFSRRRLNFIEGSNVTLTVADDGVNEEVDVTIAASGGGGGGGNVGTAVLDFGAFPGSSDASVAVTGQAAIVAGSVVEAWIRHEDSADHLADEHLVETIRIVAGNIVPGTGFTIYGFNTSEVASALALGGRGPSATAVAGAQPSSPIPWIGGKGTRISGEWNVQWRWS